MNQVAVFKHSYTIPCAGSFRDAIEGLAAARRVNAGDVARSVILLLPPEVIEAFPDPGEPAADDREVVILKSGPAQGRPWRRKPRLQVRMPPGHSVAFVRKALGLALALHRGAVTIGLEPDRGTAHPELAEQLERLRALVSVLAFEPLPDGVRTREDALHVLGFPPRANPDQRTLRAKFRMLATIHHPDGEHGSHRRMAQLNAARDLLRHQG